MTLRLVFLAGLAGSVLAACGAPQALPGTGGGGGPIIPDAGTAGGGAGGGAAGGVGSGGGAGGSAGGGSAGGSSAGGGSAGGGLGGGGGGGSAGGAGGAAGGSVTPDAGVDGGTGADAGTLLDPPPFPVYLSGACPTFPTSGASVTTGDAGTVIHVSGFMSGGSAREFKLVVPRNFSPAKKYPVVVAWHWLNASANSIVTDGELAVASEQFDFIAIAPNAKKKPNGDKLYQFSWPFVEAVTVPNSPQAEEELRFFEDLLACVGQQFPIDERRVHMMGVSAGGLWASWLMTTPRANRVASFLIISGGLGKDPFNVFKIDYAPQPNKFPALVLWGGPTDMLGLDFNQASIRLRDELAADNHFVVTCTHTAGHGMPPLAVPATGTKFKPLYQFLMEHPFGKPAKTSPWQQTGLPPDAPSWCTIVTP